MAGRGRASRYIYVALLGLCLSGIAPARRVMAESRAGLSPRVMAAFCVAGGFDYLIGLEEFTALHDLAVWCPNGHITAARSLAGMGMPNADRGVRMQAVQALGAQVAALAEERTLVAEEFIELLADTLRRDEAESVREEAVRAIRDLAVVAEGKLDGMAKECLEEITRAAVDDPAMHVRVPAVEALGTVAVRALAMDRQEVAEEIFTTLVEQALHDKEGPVRGAAARALGRLAIGALAVDERLARRCVALLAAEGLEDDDDLHVRWMATNALGKVATAAQPSHLPVAELAIDGLRDKALEDEEEHIRERAGEILQGLGAA